MRCHTSNSGIRLLAIFVVNIWLILCFSLTPTAIDYREPNAWATMQQPSSVVHSKLQYTQPLNSQKDTEKQVFSSVYDQLITCAESDTGSVCM